MLTLPRRFLAILGRYSTYSYAASIFLGLALPQLAASLRPFIPVSIFIFIVLAFARANLDGVQAVLRAPGQLAAGLVLSTLLPPFLAACLLFSPAGQMLDPEIRLAIALMAAAPPLMASPVYAALLGCDNSYSLAILVIGMAICPLVSPLIASVLAQAYVPLSPLDLAQRLALFVGGGMATGVLARRMIGAARFVGIKAELDGLGVVLFFLFAIAAMDGVLDAINHSPLPMAGMLALSTVIAGVTYAASYGLASFLPFNHRFSGSIGVGMRNMGLIIAPILGILPKNTFLYFALAQIPIYVAPLALSALKARLERSNLPPPDKG